MTALDGVFGGALCGTASAARDSDEADRVGVHSERGERNRHSESGLAPSVWTVKQQSDSSYREVDRRTLYTQPYTASQGT
jgi:hypothetical protein